MSTEIYVTYLNNNAVPIETSYGRGPQHTLPLITVAHVIEVFACGDSSKPIPQISQFSNVIAANR